MCPTMGQDHGTGSRSCGAAGCLNAGGCGLLRAWPLGEGPPTCCAVLGCKGIELCQLWNLALGWGTVLGYPWLAFHLRCLAPQLGLGKILRQRRAGMQAAGERGFVWLHCACCPPFVCRHPCPPPGSPLNINASGRLDNNVTGN